MLTQEHLKSILEYNSDTGVFIWKVRVAKRVHVGYVAGFDENGYIQISIKGKFYKAHRLAWMYCYGTFPADQLDHINRIRNDNRISNLREATPVQNGRNSKKKSNNTSGYKGVYWKKNKLAAVATMNRKKVHIGYFDDVIDAAKAYDLFCLKNHGSFCIQKGY